ncbi:L-threonine ammonia-lyase-like [Anopheles bellator]|uniref:L-threonine ammonia-lyase-like n=1 Tax=Anopheles bellator TaxID=139047 RepID=UPI00264A4C2B|nr:L-threonine ammonia-lyase-like [Anopheles bellator]
MRVDAGRLLAGFTATTKNIAPNTIVSSFRASWNVPNFRDFHAALFRGVELEKCPSFKRTTENCRRSFVSNQETVADGLVVLWAGKMVVVKEKRIVLVIFRPVELEKCVVEGAGATGLAAIMAAHLNEFMGKRLVLLICGGNIDTTMFGKCLERGMAAEGRLQR